MATLKEWVKVTRIQTAAVTMLSLWVGHMVVSPLDIESTLVLGFIGLGVHIWGFTLNEVYDAEYDKKFGLDTGHPIATGVIDKEDAQILAWSSGATALLAYMIAVSSPFGFLALVLSFGHGYMYNIRSKKDWFSNAYLAAWVFFMVLAGALSAGGINFPVVLVGLILAIQIFVQVIEGDMKDIQGPESTFAEWLGVKVDEYTNEIEYSVHFIGGLLLWKAAEAAMIFMLIIWVQELSTARGLINIGMFIVVAALFGETLRGWLVNTLDRDKIKEQSSKHEIVSIVFLAVGLLGYDMYGAVLVALIPIVWYIGVNSAIHRGSLNPDI